ncbi:MAG: ATPase domain-containing protein [Candidatus Methanofastidiosia archaeon]|jgi:circadian clock protein KaiC
MRVKTGIQELDKKLGGGFYRSSTIVVSGPPAVGKTILGLQFLFNGAKKFGEKGAYITLSESVSKTKAFCEKLEFYDNRLVEDGMVTFTDLGPLMMRHKLDVRSVLHEIGLLMENTSAERIVIDPITIISFAVQDTYESRIAILRMSGVISSMGSTSILISEANENTGIPFFPIEEFVSDAVVRLAVHHSEIGEEFERLMQIRKLRGSDHERKWIRYDITEEGIVGIGADVVEVLSER